ncbi:unnamed protein product [Miscanthus lutarioriparius]|uniref:WAT1-related protein n=1 Tax=Miscanthus lutarioriparius TaxID=422564 RepID=A0A811MCC5_9POAL|nr:unnamed protein product [Miscanthus lutarioriparius]
MEGPSSPSLKLKAEWGPAICMVLIEVFTTGQMLLTKVVVDAGLFVFALLTYRFFLGTLLVVPLAIIFERGKWKEIKLKAFIWIFTSALVGFTIPGLYYIGLGDTSPGYAINFYNIIPIATFVLAILFRKEPLNLKSLVGNIKVIGTLVCVGGTLVISLYKGKVLHLWPTNIIGYHPKQSGSAFGHHHMRGTVLLIVSCLSLAVWYTVQNVPTVRLNGPDAESVPVQVLVHSCHMLRGLHPNGCCRGRNEQRKGDLAAEMEHEPAYNCLFGKSGNPQY